MITGVIEKRGEEVVGVMCARSKDMKTQNTHQANSNSRMWRRQGGMRRALHITRWRWRLCDDEYAWVERRYIRNNRRWIYVEEVSPMASGRMLLLKCTMFVDPIVEQEVMM